MQGEVWVVWLGRGHVVFLGRERGRKEGARREMKKDMRVWGRHFINTVEPLYSGHHWEPTFCEVSLTQGLPVYLW